MYDNSDLCRKNFVYIRKFNNLTQEEMAKIINMSRSAVANYETKVRDVDSLCILKICEHFNIPVNDFFTTDLSKIDKNYFIENKLKNTLKMEIDKMNLVQLKKIQQMIDIIK